MPFDPSPAPPSPPASETVEETAALNTYIRRKVVRTVVVLLALVIAVGILGKRYESELFGAANWVYDTVGLGGILGIVFATDSFVSPFPPDLLLVVVAKSELHTQWVPVVAAMGVLSTLAGNVGWAMGRYVGGTRVVRRVLSRFRTRDQELVARYGRWGIVLGALTPIPFSVTCWTAGLVHMRFADVFWPTLLRIPRFFAYYAAIAWADRITALFM